MTQDDKKFLEWWKTRWLGNQHNIRYELIDEAKMLMGVDLKTNGKHELDNTAKIIHNHGIQLLQQKEMETQYSKGNSVEEYTNFVSDEFGPVQPFEVKTIPDEVSPVTIEVTEEVFKELKNADEVEFIPINKRKKKK